VNSLSELQADSLLSYLIAFLSPALDAVIPIFPSETAVVALGVTTAGSIDPRLILLVMLAAVGACVGDNLCFAIGRYFGPWVDRRFCASKRGAERLAWAHKTLERFGGRAIIVCRFVPGGRTVVTFTCGAVGYPWRRFAGITVVSGVIWATYAFVIGRVGGTTFAGKPWLGLVVAMGLAFGVTLAIEAVRRIMGRRRRSLERRDSRCGLGRGGQHPPNREDHAGGRTGPSTQPSRARSTAARV
jgi:membrane-associated protein